MRTALPERRRCPRISMERGAKVYDPRSRRYRPARTINASRRGFLLEVRGGLPSERGQRLELLVDWLGTGGAGRRGDLLAVTVARVEPRRSNQPVQRIAVTRGDHAAAAARRAEPLAA